MHQINNINSLVQHQDNADLTYLQPIKPSKNDLFAHFSQPLPDFSEEIKTENHLHAPSSLPALLDETVVRPFNPLQDISIDIP
jgi:hypothetical protein